MDGAGARGPSPRLPSKVPAGRRTLYVTRPEQVQAQERRTYDPRNVMDRWRAALRRDWQRRFPRRTRAWLAALLLGDRGLLDDSTRESFRRSGQSHLLAISGLHVGIIFGVLIWPLRRLRAVTPRRAAVLATLLLVPYAGLAGGDPPVLRALVFGVLGTVTALRGGAGSLPHRLAVAVLVVGALCGGEVDRPGFLLSFAAVAGIALLAGARRHQEPWPQSAATRWRARLGQSQRRVRLSMYRQERAQWRGWCRCRVPAWSR